MKIDPKRFQKIRDLKPPTNIKQVKQLLGFYSHWMTFVPRFSIISAPIRQLLHRDVPFHWGESRKTPLNNQNKHFYLILFSSIPT
jgi:hypothetical protein